MCWYSFSRDFTSRLECEDKGHFRFRDPFQKYQEVPRLNRKIRTSEGRHEQVGISDNRLKRVGGRDGSRVCLTVPGRPGNEYDERNRLTRRRKGTRLLEIS